jgi:hypothetical protein
MPRYAKGSLDEALWQDIQALHDSKDLEAETRTNSTISRAHRHEALAAEISPIDRVRGIKALCRMHEMGWVSTDNFLSVCSNILKGE